MDNQKIIKYGTPVIDGKLDDIYLTSHCVEEKPLEHCYYRPLGEQETIPYMKNTCAKTYYLHDDEYLYVCARVHDETLCSRGAEWRMNDKWPWNDDGAEIYLWFSDKDCMAIHSDAHNIRSVVDEHIWGMHCSAGTYRDTPREDWAATVDEDNQNYTVELRIKLPDYVKTGSVIGSFAEIDDRFAVGEGSEKYVSALCPKNSNPGAEEHHAILGPKE